MTREFIRNEFKFIVRSNSVYHTIRVYYLGYFLRQFKLSVEVSFTDLEKMLLK